MLIRNILILTLRVILALIQALVLSFGDVNDLPKMLNKPVVEEGQRSLQTQLLLVQRLESVWKANPETSHFL